MAEEAQVRRQERQDRDELRSTYQQSFWYEIDLTNEHADELRGALTRYVEAARKTGSDRSARARSTGRSRSSKSDVSPVAVREWAKAKGIEVSSRGRVPQSVIEQFKAAGN
jgi:hypothetical protein